MSAAQDLVHCPLCDTPHRRGAVTCDNCEQRLDERPDFEAMRREIKTHKIRMASGALAIAVMVVLNLLVFEGAGMIILTAPIGFVLFSAIRYRALSARLRRADGSL